ncbi:type I-E CRISPR-associated protein Cas6/Cse3/CasE [Streptomyces uncialis]|uniref:type I-E CRISPR-associated protein Cas6/Cse3/CasE n=1 Tax=Streptomyces uncialis TaxID=1048205 RepID=UPI0038644994|nr:type I-E CRISPR-associated protein Cas6/Cse3/CasE [Streptomyces uncialis]
MTYLSRIRINPLRAESRRLLADPRTLHGAVMGGLPGPVDGERLLWRLDADDPHRPHVLVLTRSRPDWTHIVERAGWPGADGEHAVVREYRPLLERVRPGAEFAFRLTANPVQNTSAPVQPTRAQAKRLADRAEGERTRGFRIAHRTAAEQLTWFLGRAEKSWGFTVPEARKDPPAPGLLPPDPPENPGGGDAHPEAAGAPGRPKGPCEVRIVARRRHSFRKGGSGHQVTFHSATFEGHLRVTDPDAFRAVLLSGIGPSKAYGCGLMTLSPLPVSGCCPSGTHQSAEQ